MNLGRCKELRKMGGQKYDVMVQNNGVI